uniref:Ribosomal protein L19 n=1 Tax=Haptolina brevifila TaxID=156173 RepID=A0A7S2ITW8_9EUKA
MELGVGSRLASHDVASAPTSKGMLASMSSSLLRQHATCVTLFSRGLAQRIPKRKVYPQWSSPAPQHEMWLPNSWMGSYYKLRENDPAAMRNREKLKSRRTPTVGRFIVNALERIERDKMEAQEPWRMTTYKPGDYLQVEHRPAVGETPDTIVGVMIGMYRRGLGSSFRLLCNLDNSPVEYQFMLYSPLLVNISVRKPSEWRNKQRKLFKLRDQVQKLSFPAPMFEDGDPRKRKNQTGGGGKKKR